MPNRKLRSLILFLLFVSFILAGCKKDVVPEDYTNSNDFIQNLNIDANYARGIYQRPSGGYAITFSTTANRSYTDVGVVLIDEFGQVQRVSTAGGSLNEILNQSTMDEQGNIYLAGTTFSPDLKLGQASKKSSWEDAYLVKFDANGNKLWETVYADTANGSKGTQMDQFWSVHVIGQKVFCLGSTRNFNYPPYNPSMMDNWLVVFNTEGEFLYEQILPTLHVPWFWGDHYFGAVSLSNQDILFRWSTPQDYGTSNHDTSLMLIRYDPNNEYVKWVNYYKTATDEGNVMPIGELPNGDIVGCKYDNTALVRYNGATGEVQETTPTGFKEQMGDVHLLFADKITIHADGSDRYVLGTVDNNVSLTFASNYIQYALNNSKPMIFKFNETQGMVYSKTLDFKAGLNTMLVKEDGNLLLVGSIRSFGSKRRTLFLMTIDKEGNIIKP